MSNNEDITGRGGREGGKSVGHEKRGEGTNKEGGQRRETVKRRERRG